MATASPRSDTSDIHSGRLQLKVTGEKMEGQSR
ncbi:mCG1040556, isoform CRA_c [Mus musculus]|nr:mCG1040556, isoform CRA_c [Mus musculus]